MINKLILIFLFSFAALAVKAQNSAELNDDSQNHLDTIPGCCSSANVWFTTLNGEQKMKQIEVICSVTNETMYIKCKWNGAYEFVITDGTTIQKFTEVNAAIRSLCKCSN